MSRRGENIRKRKDGRWEGRYYIVPSPSGKSVVHSVYARTYNEVKEKLSAARLSADSVTERKAADMERCFQLIAEEWLTVIENSKKRTTYMKYHSIYEKYLKKQLGELPFSKLNEDSFAALFQKSGNELFSESLQKSIACVLNQILSHAAFYYDIQPLSYSCQKQKGRKKPIEILNQTEQSKLLHYLYQEMDICKLGILLCISTGLRLGEVCSLKWNDVDLKGKILSVHTTVQRIAVNGRDTRTVLMEGEPKSICSKREIPLSEEIIKLLHPYYSSSETYLFRCGKPMDPRTYQNKFQKYLQMAGVEKKNFHILRHTFATNCINSGMDIKSLSEILGHSDVTITLNRYVHPTIETKRQHMNALSVIYGQYLGQ